MYKERSCLYNPIHVYFWYPSALKGVDLIWEWQPAGVWVHQQESQGHRGCSSPFVPRLQGLRGCDDTSGTSALVNPLKHPKAEFYLDNYSPFYLGTVGMISRSSSAFLLEGTLFDACWSRSSRPLSSRNSKVVRGHCYDGHLCPCAHRWVGGTFLGLVECRFMADVARHVVRWDQTGCWDENHKLTAFSSPKQSIHPNPRWDMSTAMVAMAAMVMAMSSEANQWWWF